VTGILVSVAPPTSHGRLYPRYDKASGILAAESKVERPWPFGIDIDGRLIFDVDQQGVLANFDLHVPRDRWQKNLEDELPRIASPGDLVFSSEAIATKSFSLPLQVRTDRLSCRLRIEFGWNKPDRAIALSDSCVALLSADELVGFAIKDIA
jgi:hypothetical protein